MNYTLKMNKISVAINHSGISETAQYKNIPGEQLLAKLVCLEGPKDGSHFLRASIKVDESDFCLSRSNENLSDTAVLIIIDCDKSINSDGEEVNGAPEPMIIHEILKSLNIAHLLLGSYSHYTDENISRYRILSLTDTPYTRAQLKPTVENLVSQINAQIIEGPLLAYAKENNTWSQPWYLPRRDSRSTKEILDLRYLEGGFVEVKEPIVSAEVVKHEYHLKEGELSPINAYNEQKDIRALLQSGGCKRTLISSSSERYLHPNSDSGEAGIIVKDNKMFSYHGCDELNDGYWHGVFDLMMNQKGLSLNDAVIFAAHNTFATDGRTVDEYNKSLFQPAPNEWPDPTPLEETLGPPKFPINSLPEMIREAVLEAEREAQAPQGLIASCALGAISLACHAYVNVRLDSAKVYPTSLYLLTIAKSGERKTTCDKLFSGGIKQMEKELLQEYEAKYAKYFNLLKKWEAKEKGVLAKIAGLATSGKDTTAEETRYNILAEEKPVEPPKQQLIYENLTPEALVKGLQNGYPAIGIFSSEAGAVVGAHGMISDSAQNFLSLLNKTWDADSYVLSRKTTESACIANKRVTLGLQLQKEALEAFYEKRGTMAKGMGFFARCLISEPESTQGSRMYKEPPLDLKHLNLFNKRVYQILSLQLPLSETSTHSNLELSPQELQLSDEAKSVWIEFYNKTEAKLNIGEELCELSDFGSKIAQIALRMAALFHYFETMTHDKPIPKAAMEAACEIARYYLKEAQRFYPSFSTSPEVSNAIKLDKWMTMFCLENATDKLSLSFISTHGPYSIRNKKVRDEALAVLEDYNRCRKVKSDNKLYVHINPKILNILKH